ncbi:hypothetical protein HN587_03060 [Candidatus Woesearchaeota archaeon]|jgi:hypothetical protein|nr:hypothetical protein [Candidatus Woesearchaeota archaeon]
MGARVGEETAKRITTVMFSEFGDRPEESFLRAELERYIPQLSRSSDAEIKRWVQYQSMVYLSKLKPIMGVPIASLNPSFIGDISQILMSSKGLGIYTRAATKENGYRMQVHNGIQGDGVIKDTVAFTRQFTSYDLCMFPELVSTFRQLPVMVGDAELVSRHYEHLAGFNRVDARLPDARFWPKKGTNQVDSELLRAYLANELTGHDLFEDCGTSRYPVSEFELTLAFHGLFSIAHPDTWERSVEEQMDSLVNLSTLPVNYRAIDGLLDKLEGFIEARDLNARVAKRKPVKTHHQLRRFMEEADEQGLEGIVVVQNSYTPQGTSTFDVGKSFKIKKYETIDAVLLGLYLSDKSEGASEENIEGAVLGLFDERLGKYVPAFKVNLDPSGIQIKNEDQRTRLIDLRKNLVKELGGRQPSDQKLVSLYDVYMFEGKFLVRSLLGDTAGLDDQVEHMLDNLPRGKTLISLFDQYKTSREDYDSGKKGVKKASTKTDQFIYAHKGVFANILTLRGTNRRGYLRFRKYFGEAKNMKQVSQRLKNPQYVVDVDNSDPIILEAKVFDLKCARNPFPAGYHSWFMNSFNLTNCFAERVRYDKNTTTDYVTVYELALPNTLKGKKRK